MGAALRFGGGGLIVPRILSGHGRGRHLAGPKDRRVRPTGARVRQSLFDILAPRLSGARFLDLCAGSGAMGLEALSRGAAHATFVDRAVGSQKLILRNLAALGTAGQATVLKAEAVSALGALRRSGQLFDIVYFDPPYESDVYEPALEGLAAVLAPGGVVIAEHFHKRPLPETIGALSRSRQTRAGDHVLTFYELRS